MDEPLISKLVEVFALPLFSHICFGQIGAFDCASLSWGVEGMTLEFYMGCDLCAEFG